MFVPRALRLKGVRETKPKPSKPPPEVTQRRQDEALVDAMQGISTNSPTPQEEQIEPKAPPRGGPKFTVKAITPEYLLQLVVGMELIFSDYAHQEEVRADWLQQRYRAVDEGEYCKVKHGNLFLNANSEAKSYISRLSSNIRTSRASSLKRRTCYSNRRSGNTHPRFSSSRATATISAECRLLILPNFFLKIRSSRSTTMACPSGTNEQYTWNRTYETSVRLQLESRTGFESMAS